MIQRILLFLYTLFETMTSMLPSPKPATFELDGRSQSTVEDVLEQTIKTSQAEGKHEPFFVVDLDAVQRKLFQWNSLLPRVKPFYAVKCNPDLVVLKKLADIGCGFDCASRNEIRLILSLGVTPDRIVYSNPCKPPSHITFAAKNDVDLTVFDNEGELYKIKHLNYEARLMLRIRTDDPLAINGFSTKYGCSYAESQELLILAKQLRMNVVGVSFHVGSGCLNPVAFSQAVTAAKKIFDYASGIGMNLTLLDIGGGFPGHPEPTAFQNICDELVPALNRHFPADSGVSIIAEPGRFFVTSAFTLCVNIIGKRVRREVDNKKEPAVMYYLSEGLYGSFSCLQIDPVTHQPSGRLKARLPSAYTIAEEEACILWGPTCDSIDCISMSTLLPNLDIGQWLIYENMGAYTIACSSNFNDLDSPYKIYVH